MHGWKYAWVNKDAFPACFLASHPTLNPGRTDRRVRRPRISQCVQFPVLPFRSLFPIPSPTPSLPTQPC